MTGSQILAGPPRWDPAPSESGGGGHSDDPHLACQRASRHVWHGPGVLAGLVDFGSVAPECLPGDLGQRSSLGVECLGPHQLALDPFEVRLGESVVLAARLAARHPALLPTGRSTVPNDSPRRAVTVGALPCRLDRALTWASHPSGQGPPAVIAAQSRLRASGSNPWRLDQRLYAWPHDRSWTAADALEVSPDGHANQPFECEGR